MLDFILELIYFNSICWELFVVLTLFSFYTTGVFFFTNLYYLCNKRYYPIHFFVDLISIVNGITRNGLEHTIATSKCHSYLENKYLLMQQGLVLVRWYALFEVPMIELLFINWKYSLSISIFLKLYFLCRACFFHHISYIWIFCFCSLADYFRIWNIVYFFPEKTLFC